MDIRTYAINELTRIGMYGSDNKIDDERCEHILKVIDSFADNADYDFSMEYVNGSIIEKLLRREPLSPLIGNDDEWEEIDHGYYRNNRYSRVLKAGKSGQAYDTHGKIFVDSDGTSIGVNPDSNVYIEFPYTPKVNNVKLERINTEIDYAKVSQYLKEYYGCSRILIDFCELKGKMVIYKHHILKDGRLRMGSPTSYDYKDFESITRRLNNKTE
jgi:hypothetical protein